MKVGVIISTYNNPDWLEKTLWGYMHQSRPADEIIIADDGSGEDTQAMIRDFSKKMPIVHVWHEDKGFRKTIILNKAIQATDADYLIFTDQDCIPRKDFIETHIRYSKKGYFLSGGHFLLPEAISKKIRLDDIRSQRTFSLKWLVIKGLKCNFKCTKLVRCRLFSRFMNLITPTNASWNGNNSSGWREDALKVNGFNTLMLYGGEDREFGERLFNMGIRSKQIRYSAIVIHLDHPRPYKNEEDMMKNREIWDNTKKQKIIYCPNGIEA